MLDTQKPCKCTRPKLLWREKVMGASKRLAESILASKRTAGLESNSLHGNLAQALRVLQRHARAEAGSYRTSRTFMSGFRYDFLLKALLIHQWDRTLVLVGQLIEQSTRDGIVDRNYVLQKCSVRSDLMRSFTAYLTDSFKPMIYFLERLSLIVQRRRDSPVCVAYTTCYLSAAISRGVWCQRKYCVGTQVDTQSRHINLLLVSEHLFKASLP